MGVNYLSVDEIALKWDISARSVRNYCVSGRVPGAVLQCGAWRIPADAVIPARKRRIRPLPKTVGGILSVEKSCHLKGGLYHQVQIDLTYNSNHLEGSRLTHDQTRWIFETMTLGEVAPELSVNDIVETANHFRCIDMVIDTYRARITEPYIKRLHLTLKNGTSDSRKEWFAVGEYKRLPNSVHDIETAKPEEVHRKIAELLARYESCRIKTFDDILDFHVGFETIHPFQDGNGRVGRLLLFKECLKANILPFIIDESLKRFYYRGLHEWESVREYLRDTCRTGQDRFAEMLNHYGHQFDVQYGD